ncbi:MAG: quinone-dependent dihydroorotate dehydrogenase [Bacteroidia bacterium]
MTWSLLREIAFLFPAETAHELTFRLARFFSFLWHRQPPAACPINLGGIRLRHPIGLAAGMDKEGILLPLWAHIGFSFVEVGTVTPLPQPGHPKPRLFRIRKEGALLNRMGFPSTGAYAVAKNLEHRPEGLIVGISLGKNFHTPLDQAAQDYAKVMQVLGDKGDFFVINVSSPNTPQLRRLQHFDALKRILDALAPYNPHDKPLFIKLSPDLPREKIENLLRNEKALGHAGWIAGNTTTQIGYPSLPAGGVSGSPLRPFRAALQEALRDSTLPHIAVGGIDSAAEVKKALSHGAAAVQIYTALVYQGPAVVSRWLKEVCPTSKPLSKTNAR